MKKKEELKLKRHGRILSRVHGTPLRPRALIIRSLKNLGVQVIDDTQRRIIFSVSTCDKDIRKQFVSAGNVKAAELLGDVFAKKAIEKGITKIVFDRGGNLYHGRIKAFAEAARKGGIEF